MMNLMKRLDPYALALGVVDSNRVEHALFLTRSSLKSKKRMTVTRLYAH